MAKKLNKKKLFLGGTAIIAVILLVVLVVLLVNVFKTKSYDIEEIHDGLVLEYKDLYLTDMDQFDVLELFGFDKNEVEDALYLKSLQMDSEGNDVTEDVNYVIVMNTKDYQEYYEIFESHVDSYLMHTEDDKEYKLYSKAIMKSDKNYVYLIISNKAKSIEKFINE